MPSVGYGYGRLEKLLSFGDYRGMGSTILIEGPFIQLKDKAESWRQVYLGLTKRELLVATQVPPNYVDTPEVYYITDVDPELDGLELKLSLPLRFIRFYMVEERSRRFAVSSCTDHVYYFELCQFEHNTEEFWRRWCSQIAKYCNGTRVGFHAWRSHFVAKIRRNKKGGVRTKTLQFVTHPFPVNSVKTIGIQTDTQFLPASQSSKHIRCMPTPVPSEVSSIAYKGEGAGAIVKKTSTAADFTFRFAEVTANVRRLHFKADMNFYPEYMRDLRHYIIGNSRSQTDIGTKPSTEGKSQSHRSILNSDEENYNLVGSQSLPDVLGCRSDGEKHVQDLYSQMTVYLMLSSLGRKTKSKLPFVVTRRLRKITSARQSAICEKAMDINSSESEESITDLVYNSTGRNSKWQYAYNRVRQENLNKKSLKLEEIVLNVSFLTCQKKQSEEDFSLNKVIPSDVAKELTLLMRHMVMKTKQTTIVDCCHNKHGWRMLSSLLPLQFSTGISDWVMKEILDRKDLDDRVWALHFYIQVVLQLLEHRDYESAYAVVRGLQLAPVTRLNETWDLLGRRMPNLIGTYLHICATVETRASYHRFKNEFPEMLRSGFPFLPRIVHFLLYSSERSEATSSFVTAEQLVHVDYAGLNSTTRIDSLDESSDTDSIDLGKKQNKKGRGKEEKGAKKKEDKTSPKKMKGKKGRFWKKKSKKQKDLEFQYQVTSPSKDSLEKKISLTEKPSKGKKGFFKRKKNNATQEKASASTISSSSHSEEIDLGNTSTANTSMPGQSTNSGPGVQDEVARPRDVSLIQNEVEPHSSKDLPRKSREFSYESSNNSAGSSEKNNSGRQLHMSSSRRLSSLQIEKDDDVMDKEVSKFMAPLTGGKDRRKSMDLFTNILNENKATNMKREPSSNNNAETKCVHFETEAEKTWKRNQNENASEGADYTRDGGGCDPWQLFLFVQIGASRYAIPSNVKLRRYLKQCMLSCDGYSLFQISKLQEEM